MLLAKLKGIESFTCAPFTNVIEEFSFNFQALMSKCYIACTRPKFLFSLCANREKVPSSPLLPPTLPQPPLIWVLDWLIVSFKVRSHCYWPTTQTRNQRIEEWINSKYTRYQLAQSAVIGIVFIFQQCHSFRGGKLIALQ
jgi:hypothetical protein